MLAHINVYNLNLCKNTDKHNECTYTYMHNSSSVISYSILGSCLCKCSCIYNDAWCFFTITPGLIVQLICIIVVSILIHVLNNLYVPQPDDIVYDMARNQEKSPYPSRGDYRDYYR